MTDRDRIRRDRAWLESRRAVSCVRYPPAPRLESSPCAVRLHVPDCAHARHRAHGLSRPVRRSKRRARGTSCRTVRPRAPAANAPAHKWFQSDSKGGLHYAWLLPKDYDGKTPRNLAVDPARLEPRLAVGAGQQDQNKWLDADKTSPYAFYQFWLNTDDRDVVPFLKYFTFLTQAEVEALAEKVQTEPEKREAQRTLAREVTTLVHGAEAMNRAVEVSQALFSGDLKSLSAREVEECFADAPSTTVETADMLLLELLIEIGAAKSKREAREYLSNGAVSVNGEKVTDLEAQVSNLERLGGQFLVIRRGKKNYFLVEFAG